MAHQVMLRTQLYKCSLRTSTWTRTNVSSRPFLAAKLGANVSSLRFGSDQGVKVGCEENPITHWDLTKSLDLSQPIGTLESPVLEPAFRELGLASAYPSGMLQSLMELLHVDVGLPWWGTIVTTTLVLRLALFPLVIKAQKHSVATNNLLPELQKRQMAMRETKNPDEVLKAQLKYMKFMEENNINPIKNMGPMFLQGLTFCSMFFALRGMTSAPVMSMTTGGLLWFTDLTTTDPYFFLPLITATSVFIHIKMGADGVSIQSLPAGVRVFLLAMPWIGLPFMCQFPTALNLYWMTSNLISIAQSRLLQHPKIRPAFGLEEMIKWKKEDLPMKSGFELFQATTNNSERKSNQRKSFHEESQDSESKKEN